MTILLRPRIDATRPNQPLEQTRAAPSSPQGLLTDELALGRRKLNTAFGALPPRSLKPDELLMAPDYKRAIFRLRTGWAYRSCDLSNGRTVILDVYIPRDVIGLDTLLQTRQTERVSILTSATLEVIPAENGLLDLVVDRPLAIYIFWLLAQRQRRMDRHLAANTRLEPQGRLATMILDFYVRLRRRRLTTGLTYNLPLTQSQIGDYLGLSAVHVNRVLRSLRQDDVVNMEKNSATILNLERLTRLSHAGEVVSPALRSASAVVGSSLPTP